MEHDERWHETVTATLADRGLGNVDYILAPGDQPMERGGDSAYARTALAFPDDSIDFALVDGHYRDYSAKFILPKIKPGGMLIIDNVNWYLPCQSRAPNSRTAALGPLTPVWAEVSGRAGRLAVDLDELPGYGTRLSSSRADFVRTQPHVAP